LVEFKKQIHFYRLVSFFLVVVLVRFSFQFTLFLVFRLSRLQFAFAFSNLLLAIGQSFG